MTILALEFSTEQRSVAVRHVGGMSRAASDSRAIGGLTLVAQALQQAGIEREAVDCLAIGLGPGSYTGVRSAIAIAQGWQLARAVKLIGVDTTECLATQARNAGWQGRVNFVIDAQRGEFYLVTYGIEDGGVYVIEPLRIVTRDEIGFRAQAGERIAGPEVTRWFPAGETLVPDAGVMAELAVGRSGLIAGDQLEPIYLREANFVKAPPPRII